MDNFPSQHGVRIGIETEADIDDVGSNDEHDMDMMDLDENETNPNPNTASIQLGELQQLLLDKKNMRIIRHLTDSSVERHQRALSQATRPLYLAIARVLSISLPDYGSKLQMHNAILESVWMNFSFFS